MLWTLKYILTRVAFKKNCQIKLKFVISVPNGTAKIMHCINLIIIFSQNLFCQNNWLISTIISLV